MLNPTADRLNYGEILEPPEGFALHSAVGTTYSLDFSVLAGACISLGLSEGMGSGLLSGPVYLFEALRRTSGRLAVFCEGGQIHLPANNSPLYMLLEKIVFEVKLKGRKPYPSFHPKFWFIKYVDGGGNFLYRLLVLSRNLTQDRSWDVAVKLEGRLAESEMERSGPIADFLLYLASNIKENDSACKAKRSMVRQLAKDARFVDFRPDSKMFSDVHFIPLGIGGQGMKGTPLFSGTFHEVLIMSPFLSAGVIEAFNNPVRRIKNPKRTLITRRESLEKLKPHHCDKFWIYTLRDKVIDGEAALSEEIADICRQDIHAKLYLWCKYPDAEIYLGSLNASDSALNRNIEFMVRLVSKMSILNTEKLTGALFCGDENGPDNPFIRCELPDRVESEKDIDSILANRIRAFCRGRLSARVTQPGEGYSITISCEQVPDSSGMAIGPLLCTQDAGIADRVCFNSLRLTELSSFYRVRAAEEGRVLSRVIKIETSDMPDNRENALVSGIINNPISFYQYVAFLLGDNYLVSAFEGHGDGASGSRKKSMNTFLPALYERMLKIAAVKPERFRDLEDILGMLNGRETVPDGFLDMFNTFKRAVKLRG